MSTSISRRAFLKQLGLASAGIALAGCAAPGPTSTSDAGGDGMASDENVMLTMWGGAFLMNANQNIFDNSDFAKEHPNYTLEATPASGNLYGQKMKVAIAAGDPEPDIMLVHYRFVKDFLLPDISVDLSDRVDEGGFSPDIFKSVKVDGKIYGIPYEVATFVNYYREDVLTDLGMELPSNRTEYFEVGNTIKEQSGQNWTFVDKATGNTQLYLAMLMMLEGDVFDAETGDVILDTDAGKGVDAATLLKELSDSGFTSPLRFDSPEGFEEVKNSETVGNLTPYAWIHRMMDALVPEDEVFGKWRIGHAPALLDGGTNAVSHNGAYLAVNKLSPNPEAAWDVAAFFGQSVEGVQALSDQFVIIGAYKPGLEAVKEKSEGWDIFGGQRAQSQMAEVALREDLKVITMHPNMAEGQKVIDEALTRMLNGDATPEQAVMESAGKIRGIDKG